jgi:DNA-binding LacI/PurR family transcriptional regulator
LISDREIPGFTCLVIDRAASVAAATRRLIQLGHHRIAFLSGVLAANKKKLEGYQSVMAEHGLSTDGLVFESARRLQATRDRVMERFDAFSAVTAVVTTSDLEAVEVVSALHRKGRRVPEDCSVVGYDDVSFASSVTPTLSTLRQPREAVGEHAARMLLQLMRGEQVSNVILVPELIERESIGPLHAGFSLKVEERT